MARSQGLGFRRCQGIECLEVYPVLITISFASFSCKGKVCLINYPVAPGREEKIGDFWAISGGDGLRGRISGDLAGG